MGVLYSVFPLDKELAEYLGELEVTLPAPPITSRCPTPQELRIVAGSIPDIRSTASQDEDGRLQEIDLCDATQPKSGPWTVLQIDGYVDEVTPCRLSFHKGWPDLVLEVAIRLSRLTGPLVIFADGESPVIATPDCSVPSLLSAWQ